MKVKAIIWILAFVIVSPAVITYVGLNHQKEVLREEVKEKLIAGVDRNKLVFLKFEEDKAAKELRWKHDKEFEYRGEMYDVLEVLYSNDSAYYWCWPDKGETRLNAQLDLALFRLLGEDPERESQKDRLAQFYKSLYWEDAVVKTGLVSKKIKTVEPLFLICSGFGDVHDPPPEVKS